MCGFLHWAAAPSRVNKMQFSDRHLQVSDTAGDMGSQNFNFSPKFHQNWDSSPKFCIFGRKFPNTKKISRQSKFRWSQIACLPATTPLTMGPRRRAGLPGTGQRASNHWLVARYCYQSTYLETAYQ